MEVRTDSKNGTAVTSSSDTIKTFAAEIQVCKEQWSQQLRDNPDCFADIEQQIDQHYRLGGGPLVASLLAEVCQTPPMDQHAQQVSQNAVMPRGIFSNHRPN